MYYISATIRIGREIQCLLYTRFFLNKQDAYCRTGLRLHITVAAGPGEGVYSAWLVCAFPFLKINWKIIVCFHLHSSEAILIHVLKFFWSILAGIHHHSSEFIPSHLQISFPISINFNSSALVCINPYSCALIYIHFHSYVFIYIVNRLCQGLLYKYGYN